LAHTPYVLVVDDEQPVRSVLRRRLEKWGYAVEDAANATDALELMLAQPADIALLDIGLPGHDGLWLAERIREKWTQTAIIMATGADAIAVIAKSKALGAIDYVMKPFDQELLRQAMERAAKSVHG
jgi:DNA-binding response OmpR family regulator